MSSTTTLLSKKTDNIVNDNKRNNSLKQTSKHIMTLTSLHLLLVLKEIRQATFETQTNMINKM